MSAEQVQNQNYESQYALQTHGPPKTSSPPLEKAPLGITLLVADPFTIISTPIKHHYFHIQINTSHQYKLADSLACFFFKMAKTETQETQPPSGYPTETENPPTGKKFRPWTKKKGDRGFIEGWYPLRLMLLLAMQAPETILLSNGHLGRKTKAVSKRLQLCNL
ncbi:unnamed protein product [Malus baccata var. baccata]